MPVRASAIHSGKLPRANWQHGAAQLGSDFGTRYPAGYLLRLGVSYPATRDRFSRRLHAGANDCSRLFIRPCRFSEHGIRCVVRILVTPRSDLQQRPCDSEFGTPSFHSLWLFTARTGQQGIRIVVAKRACDGGWVPKSELLGRCAEAGGRKGSPTSKQRSRFRTLVPTHFHLPPIARPTSALGLWYPRWFPPSGVPTGRPYGALA